MRTDLQLLLPSAALPKSLAVRLLNDIGIAIQGTASPILVTLADGRKLKGTLTPNNLVVVTTEVWKN